MQWLPLESNPDVMDGWSSALGLDTQAVSFTDVYGLDPDLLAMVPTPVYAVLMLFPISKEYESYRQEERERVTAERQKTGEGLPQGNCRDVIFIKQTIGNACGTIGLLHALAHNRAFLSEDSPLERFFKECETLTPEGRSQLLESSHAIAKAHSDLAQSGQSRVPDVNEAVDLHFVCFVRARGSKTGDQDRLIELDGRKAFPIDHGPVESDLLTAVVPVIRKFMALSKHNVQFNLIALCPSGS